MIKLDLGLQVATIDVGGWDTHESQDEGSVGYLVDLLDDLSRGLAAFYTDLDGAGSNNYYTDRLTMAAQSEFGRELYENGDSGTEHGYGNQMLVLSGNAIGGLHGSWPGLAPGQLTDGTDLAVTTDYRQVLSEILIRRMCNPAIDVVFPGYTGYQPLGIVEGNEQEPPLFGDGFSPATSAPGPRSDRDSPPHSQRRARIRSTLAARRAGRKLAARVTTQQQGAGGDDRSRLDRNEIREQRPDHPVNDEQTGNPEQNSDHRQGQALRVTIRTT